MVGFLLDYWQYALIGVGVLAAVGYVHERDNRIRTEAVANERLMDFRVSNENAKTLGEAYRAVVEETTPALASLDSMRTAARARHDTAEAYAREASARLTKAGDSLTATLDSAWSVVIKAEASETLIDPVALKPVLRAARTQSRETIKAHRDAASAFRTQLNAMNTQLTAADSTSRLWRTRYTALEDAYEARVEACRECRETVEAMAAGQDTGWGSPILYTGAGAVVGAILWATFGP